MIRPNFIAIIPARYASSRFPGKPLAKIGGKPMIQLVYEQAKKAVDTVFVATDDERIFSTVQAFGGKAIMTSPSHQSGTDRCFEAYSIVKSEERRTKNDELRTMSEELRMMNEALIMKNDELIMKSEEGRTKNGCRPSGNSSFFTHHSSFSTHHSSFKEDVIINVQGDEPFIQPEQIESLAACFEDPATQIATLVKPFPYNGFFDDLANQNTPKVVINKRMEAMYFSRSIVPYKRGTDRNRWLEAHTYYKHIGMYAYRAEALCEITQLPPSPLELAENLEQLRWLENGYTIKTAITHLETIGIDTPEDLRRATEMMQKSGY